MKPNGPDVVTVEDLAIILGIGRNQAYRVVKSGQIASVRVGRRFLISRKAVDQLLRSDNESKSEPVPEPEPKPVHEPLPASLTHRAHRAHRALRGGARLSSEQLNEFTETIDALTAALQDVGDMVMRLRRIRDELIKKSNLK